MKRRITIVLLGAATFIACWATAVAAITPHG